MYFITILLAVFAVNSSSYKWHPYIKHRYCSSRPGAQCLSRNTFIYCPESWFYLKEEQEPLWCPEGYICNDQSNYPCVKDPEKLLTTLSCPSYQNLEVFKPLDSFYCNKYRGIKCLSQTAFIYCSHRWQFFVAKYDALNCPAKHICQENLVTPCILDPQWSSKECSKTAGTRLSEPTKATIHASVPNSYTSTAMPTQTTYTAETDDSTTDTPNFTESDSDQDYIEVTRKPLTILENDVVSTIRTSTDEVLTEESIVSTETTENFSNTDTFTKIIEILSKTTAELITDKKTTTDFPDAATTSNRKLNPQNALGLAELLTNEDIFFQIMNQENQTTDATPSLATKNLDFKPTAIINKNTVKPTTSNSKQPANEDFADIISTTPKNTDSSSFPKRYKNPPKCSKEGVIYAAANCHQYYHCQKFLFFWVTAYLKTCNEGMGFKSIEMRCVALSDSDCNFVNL